MWGFTRNEQKVLLFLTATFLAGWGIETVRDRFAPLPPLPPEPVIAASAMVPRPETAARSAAKAAPVFLNRATAEDLDRIPGIGPKTAARILAARAARGRFSNLDELLDVDGIGPKSLEKMRPYLRID